MSKTSTEETTKKTTAKRVVAAKRKYFVPSVGVSVLAVDAEDAVNRAQQGDEQDVESSDGE